jgi:hypothetical protein
MVRHSSATLRALAIATVLVAMTMTSSVALSADAALAASAPPALGAVVARGRQDGGYACVFDTGTPQTLESGRWLALRVSSDCVVSVDST